MVQIKQKSNKINITSLITCFMLIMVFVFGCVQFAFASDDLTLEQYIEKYPVQYYILTKSDHTNGTKNGFYSSACDFEGTPNRVCGFIVSDGTMNSGISFCSDTPWKNSYYWANGWYSWGGSASKNSDGIYNWGSSTAIKKVNEYLTNVVLFSNYEDAKTYILTGQINNAIYKPKENIEYDSDIEVPINLDIQLNGSSDFVPNVRISCNQSESIDNRVLEVSYSVGYRATWKLMGGIGLNIKSKTSPVVYGSIEQLDDSFDNSGTAFETIISLSKFSNSSPPDKDKFSQYEPTPKVYWSLKEIKNENSEIKLVFTFVLE